LKERDRLPAERRIPRLLDHRAGPGFSALLLCRREPRSTITDEAVTQVVRHVDRERRRDAEHSPRGGPPDDPIRAVHRAPPVASENSVVRAMSIMYVRCESDLGHTVMST
jgi:hypothetical protein